jgi:hypothetical protein
MINYPHIKSLKVRIYLNREKEERRRRRRKQGE